MFRIHNDCIGLGYVHYEVIRAQLQIATYLNRLVRSLTDRLLVKRTRYKMSKSLNAVIELREVVAKYKFNIIRSYLSSERYQKDLESLQIVLKSFLGLLSLI